MRSMIKMFDDLDIDHNIKPGMILRFDPDGPRYKVLTAFTKRQYYPCAHAFVQMMSGADHKFPRHLFTLANERIILENMLWIEKIKLSEAPLQKTAQSTAGTISKARRRS